MKQGNGIGKAEIIAMAAFIAVVVVVLLDTFSEKYITADNWLSVLATIVIAFFTASHFILQWFAYSLSKRKFLAERNEALFERRLKIYHLLTDFFDDFLRRGHPDLVDFHPVSVAARQEVFILNKEHLAYIQEVRSKTKEYKIAHDRWEPLRARSYIGEELSRSEQEARDRYIDEMHEIEGWFATQIDEEKPQAVFRDILDLTYF